MKTIAFAFATIIMLSSPAFAQPADTAKEIGRAHV